MGEGRKALMYVALCLLMNGTGFVDLTRSSSTKHEKLQVRTLTWVKLELKLN